MGVRRRRFVPLAVVVLLAVCGSAASGGVQSSVRHALIPEQVATVEVWEDPITQTFAFQFQGDDTVEIVTARVVFRVEGSRLAERATYPTPAQALLQAEKRYRLTPDALEAALASGDLVERPALMNPPTPDSNGTSTFQTVTYFGGNVATQRRAVKFWIPSPGLHLLGLRLSQVALLRVYGPNLPDSGPVALLDYQATASAPNIAPELTINSVPAGSAWGRSDMIFFEKSRVRLIGTGYDARLVPPQVILRHDGSYVSVFPHNWTPTRVQWRAMLARIAAS